MKRWLFLSCLLLNSLPAAFGQDPAKATLPSPQVNKDSWVMIEIWPEVKDITLSAYFLDFAYGKNKNVCEATKRVFDRDQEARAKKEGRDYSSYRLCMSVNDAILQGYVRKE